jgi:hypothetical protein
MTENVHVVGERLIAYLYDETNARERALVDAHLRVCTACAEELAGLGATRTHLAEWVPPEVALGFQISRPITADEVPATATVLRPARWWQRPTPAWAQVAAAFLIFAAGLSIGQSRTPDTDGAAPPSRQVVTTSPQAVSPQAVSPPAVSPQSATQAAAPADVASVADLARDVAQLRQQVAALSSTPSVSSAPGRTASASEADVMARVRELIADSEAGLRTDMTLRDTQLARDVELQRRSDLAMFNSNLDRVTSQTGLALRQNEQMIPGLAKPDSQPGAPGR